MTMEFVPGVKINNLDEIDRRGIDRKLLAKRSAEAYLTQLCRHGFFHCDPHPGAFLLFLFWLACLFCAIRFGYRDIILLSHTKARYKTECFCGVDVNANWCCRCHCCCGFDVSPLDGSSPGSVTKRSVFHWFAFSFTLFRTFSTSSSNNEQQHQRKSTT